MLQSADSDWHRVIKHYQLDMSALAKDLTTALDRLPRGATSISGIAENIADAIERGWVYGTLLYGDSVVRSGYLLVGMLKTKNLRNALVAISRQFEKLKVEDAVGQPAEDRRRLARRRAGRQRRSSGAPAARRRARPAAPSRRRRWASRRR